MTPQIVSGADLIRLGFKPGPWFKTALAEINAAPFDETLVMAICERLAPPPERALHAEPARYSVNLEAETALERNQLDALKVYFDALMRTPTLVAGALMPDACEAGHVGTIPVGGVAVAEGAIHPGMHSSDICCSLFVSRVDGVDPADLLNAMHKVTHFGPGGRTDGRFTLPTDLLHRMKANAFLNDSRILTAAQAHLGTAGDGNHFQSVGIMGDAATIVSHHGSRGVGALLFKLGMRVAEHCRLHVSPETLPVNAWIPAESGDGEAYWEALQIVRDWTKLNHQVLHDAAIEALGGKVSDRFWNEHNFVFRKDNLFFHAKGATPVDVSFLPDTDGRMIVPFNLAEPIAIVRGETGPSNLGFAPHGAGRHLSRRRHKQNRLVNGLSEAMIFDQETAGIDMRFFSNRIDVTELPSAYKPAGRILSAMEQFKLAHVVDWVQPYGSIMAGDWEADAPWRRNKHSLDVSES
jgi:tRNA-splicing ligase RtcB